MPRLNSGPCLIPLICDNFICFRTGKIGLVVDMQQTILQINVAEEYRDYLHFILLQEFNFDKNVILRLLKNLFRLTCSSLLPNPTV